MLRRTLLASVGAVALTGSALAADLPSRAPPPVYLPPPQVYTWTGLYVGINAGYTWGESNRVSSVGSVLATDTGNGCPAGSGCYGPVMAAGQTGVIPLSSGGGFIGGGQIGYNWQFGNTWVVGLEADIQGVAASSATGNLATTTPAPVNAGGVTNPVSSLLSASKRLDYLGTVRGRLGFLITPTLLIYGDGGLAYGGVRANTNITQSILGPGVPAAVGSPSFAAGSFSNSRVGWTAGGGVEWMFLPNWSAKVEYLYYDLGGVTFGSGATSLFLTPCGCGGFGTASAAAVSRTRFNGNIVRAGLNYHFNWGYPAPVVAKY